MNPLKKSQYDKLVEMGLEDLADKVNELAGHKKSIDPDLKKEKSSYMTQENWEEKFEKIIENAPHLNCDLSGFVGAKKYCTCYLSQIKDFVHKNFVEKKEVEEAIEGMEKREFAHTPIKGDIEHLSYPDTCSGCQAQMQFLEVLSDLRKELEDNKK